jgi:hypothetical protein
MDQLNIERRPNRKQGTRLHTHEMGQCRGINKIEWFGQGVNKISNTRKDRTGHTIQLEGVRKSPIKAKDQMRPPPDSMRLFRPKRLPGTPPSLGLAERKFF